jgi:spore coat protein U-like protein
MISSNNILKTALFTAIALCGALSMQGQAAESAVMLINAEVNDNCTIATSTLDFGNYDPISANAEAALTGTGAVTVQCTLNTAATVTLSGGMNHGGIATDRYMIGGDRRPAGDSPSNEPGEPVNLAYGLYSDASMTQAWGDELGNGVAHVGTGVETELTVYGRVPGGQNVAANQYYDTVIATVTF